HRAVAAPLGGGRGAGGAAGGAPGPPPAGALTPAAARRSPAAPLPGRHVEDVPPPPAAGAAGGATVPYSLAGYRAGGRVGVQGRPAAAEYIRAGRREVAVHAASGPIAAAVVAGCGGNPYAPPRGIRQPRVPPG